MANHFTKRVLPLKRSERGRGINFQTARSEPGETPANPPTEQQSPTTRNWIAGQAERANFQRIRSSVDKAVQQIFAVCRAFLLLDSLDVVGEPIVDTLEEGHLAIRQIESLVREGERGCEIARLQLRAILLCGPNPLNTLVDESSELMSDLAGIAACGSSEDLVHIHRNVERWQTFFNYEHSLPPVQLAFIAYMLRLIHLQFATKLAAAPRSTEIERAHWQRQYERADRRFEEAQRFHFAVRAQAAMKQQSRKGR